MRLWPVMCHTCDQWVMPWQEGWPWGSSLVHLDCYACQVDLCIELDALAESSAVLDGPLGGGHGLRGPRVRVRAPWRR